MIASPVYVQEELLGTGTYGTVHKYWVSAIRMHVAGKRTSRGQLEKEIRMYRIVGEHANIVHIHQPVVHCGCNILFMDLTEHTLYDELARSPLTACSTGARYARQLISALDHLQVRHVVHCDVKPQNIGIICQCVKLLDFGSARLICDCRPRDRVQALLYRAPEIVLGLAYACPIDIWGAGCVMWELYYGCPRFGEVRSETEIMQKMLSSPSVVGDGDTEGNAWLLVTMQACLTFHAERRCTADQCIN